ncbi:small ribosomal subunit protein uS7A-like [Musca autumnalis]|uniref:small ribosomal subunit protein uS7A-like n=1 Tax=Musca autumnalis TaxID=221902 RepID=UPI003CF6859A
MAEVAENVTESFEKQPPIATEGAETLLETNVVSTTELAEIKLFGRWPCDDMTVNGISLQDYISVKEIFARYLPHSAGCYAAKRFANAQYPIVERLICSL